MYKGIGKRLQSIKDDKAGGNPSLRRSKKKRPYRNSFRYDLFIGNVPKKAHKELREMFLPYGIKTGPYIIDPPTWKPNPYRIAFVSLKKKESVHQAIKDLNGKTLLGNKLRIKIARKSKK